MPCGIRPSNNYSRVAKSYAAFFFLRRFLVFFAFFAFAFLRRFAMICLLADVGLRAPEPDLAFDPFVRRGLEGDVSFGSIPKMPIMGLVESLLGIRFRIKQPAATYRACICRLPIGGADIVRVRAPNHEVLRFETSRRNQFSIDNENSTRGLI
jgi:hypothetical protein